MWPGGLVQAFKACRSIYTLQLQLLGRSVSWQRHAGYAGMKGRIGRAQAPKYSRRHVTLCTSTEESKASGSERITPNNTDYKSNMTVPTRVKVVQKQQEESKSYCHRMA